MAKIFSELRPEYDWFVTANQSGDGGVDFIGRQGFLKDEALGIAAAITIGGQCKKRTTVGDVVDAVVSSLVRMADRIDPTLFVVALSARLTKKRVDEAKRLIEKYHHRHCHILDRAQVEGLICTHLSAVRSIFEQALSADELADVLAYFEAVAPLAPRVEVHAPQQVLAGVPFTVTLEIEGAHRDARLQWTGLEDGDDPLTFVGPLGADTRAGAPLRPRAADDPLRTRCSLEFVSYAVGVIELGEIGVGGWHEGVVWTGLGQVRVIENLRPRFFERPFTSGLEVLGGAFERALARGVAAVGVTGAGGSGKSRLCEEFALERRRRGAEVVLAKQAKTLDDPHRLLADLLVGLAGDDAVSLDPGERVVESIARYDPNVADAAAPAVRAILGREGQADEERLLAGLVVLASARTTRTPAIVHLQDLHWCSADVLGVVERLIRHLEAVRQSRREPECGLLFVLEGRCRERDADPRAGWSTEAFEALLRTLECPVAECAVLDRDDAHDFVRRLFEDRHSAARRGSDDLRELQMDLVDRIDGASGGNPFHSLEQVRHLRERRVLATNPDTGLIYLLRPDTEPSALPDSVFAAVRARWEGLRERAPGLALVLWGAALLEDRLPGSLLDRLRHGLAPHVSPADVDATEMLWTAAGTAPEAAFRHENYFRALGRFEVSTVDRNRVVAIYDEWFASAGRLDPLDELRWARALLAGAAPETARAARLLDHALQGARAAGDGQLARRVAAAALDLGWATERRASLGTFLERCDREIFLVGELLGSDRRQAADRLARLSARVDARAGTSNNDDEEVERRQLQIEVLRANVLFNDRRPAEAADVAERVVARIRRVRGGACLREVERDALHAHGVALALSGEIDEALTICERAVAIADGAFHVVSTYANVLLARDPEASEAILRDLRRQIANSEVEDAHHQNDLNLGMALLLRGHRAGDPSALGESRALLAEVFKRCFRFGRYPDAGAAALLLGIVDAAEGQCDAPDWFGRAIVASSRGQQMETLWRAHCNLAVALHERGQPVTEAVRDHATATVELLEESLSSYADADRTPRFRLVSVPFAQAVRLLVLAGDPLGHQALERHPALRRCFADPVAAVLADDRGGYRSHEWLRVGDADYVIY